MAAPVSPPCHPSSEDLGILDNLCKCHVWAWKSWLKCASHPAFDAVVVFLIETVDQGVSFLIWRVAAKSALAVSRDMRMACRTHHFRLMMTIGRKDSHPRAVRVHHAQGHLAGWRSMGRHPQYGCLLAVGVAHPWLGLRLRRSEADSTNASERLWSGGRCQAGEHRV